MIGSLLPTSLPLSTRISSFSRNPFSSFAGCFDQSFTVTPRHCQIVGFFLRRRDGGRHARGSEAPVARERLGRDSARIAASLTTPHEARKEATFRNLQIAWHTEIA